jgi:hypothetical protein
MGQSSSLSSSLSAHNKSNILNHGGTDYEASVKQFLEIKKKEFDEKFKYSGALSQLNSTHDKRIMNLDDLELDSIFFILYSCYFIMQLLFCYFI